MSDDEFVYSTDDVLRMLDNLLAGPAWDGFYQDRAQRAPFVVEWPDENLATWLREGLLTPGRVLELGCEAALTSSAYDLVHDSGCFHHLPHTATRTTPTS